jgi:2-C-methyl-D-erythritol 4-phosphate cytidylyltransferase / 2-C-methyl-D-erythritol 2,4-cyclodiphosphate synthase
VILAECAVIVVAAGRGERFGDQGGLPKQYRMLGARAVIAHAIDAFLEVREAGMIVPVIHGDHQSLFDRCVQPNERLLPPVSGGATRQASVLAGLETLLEQPPEKVLVHDAARPFVDAATIRAVISATGPGNGAIAGLAVTDTVKRISESGLIVDTVNRNNLYLAQTPQGFPYQKLLEAHRSARTDQTMRFTDDASIAEAAGLPVTVVPGATSNFKLTVAQDWQEASDMVSARRVDVRTGNGYDVHRTTNGDHVILCGVRVPHDRGLAGHSDADVGLHALTDALLGAIGAGDIGSHFPPSDPQWKNANSELFLRRAAEFVAGLGGHVMHVDVTLVCEAPIVGPHRDAMRARIGAILGLEPARVSVKATTNENLGFLGRREGIAAFATATVRL